VFKSSLFTYVSASGATEAAGLPNASPAEESSHSGSTAGPFHRKGSKRDLIMRAGSRSEWTKPRDPEVPLPILGNA
jgi:hypothetical protein